MKARSQLNLMGTDIPRIHIHFSVILLSDSTYVIYLQTHVRGYHTPSVTIDLAVFKMWRRGMKFIGYKKSTSGKTVHFYYTPEKIAA